MWREDRTVGLESGDKWCSFSLVEAALLGPALGGNELEIERRIEGRDTVGPGLIPAQRK